MRRPLTKYVAERLGQTRWQDRDSIRYLFRLEELYSTRFGGVFYQMGLQQDALAHPLEALIIRTELKTGVRLSEAAAQDILRLKEERSRKAAYLRRKAEEERRIQEERVEYEVWLRVGGQP